MFFSLFLVASSQHRALCFCFQVKGVLEIGQKKKFKKQDTAAFYRRVTIIVNLSL